MFDLINAVTLHPCRMEGNTTRADNVQPWLPKIIFASGRSDTTPMTVFAERCCCTEKETTHVPIAGIIGALDEIHAFDLREAVEECHGATEIEFGAATTVIGSSCSSGVLSARRKSPMPP